MDNFKEVLKNLKKDIGIFFKNIKELGKAFSQPVEEEQDFEKLAIASGVDPKYIPELKQAMSGIKDFKFANELESNKNKKAIPQRENPIQQSSEQRNVGKGKTVGQERD